MARGETEISALHHIDRGYENFVEKLRGLNIDATRVSNNILTEVASGDGNGTRV